MFFNSGVRGARAKDGVGSVSNRELFVQKKDPVPSITSWAIQGTDDTSLDPAGGQTVVVTGTGFASGLTGIVGSTTLASVTVVSATTATFTSTAKSAGSYTLILSNASGAAAIYVPGITYSSIPTYTTAAGSIGTNYETTAISTQVVATSDSAITYSLATGALPSGATLYANGVITGTAPVDSSSTTYSFSITATDAELQDVTRSFTLTINTDVVTWSSPGSGTTYTVVGNTPISNVTLSATSAAGYGVTYAANALPTGLTLSSGVISGTPTVEANITSLLTATASTTNRSATNTIYWVVTLNDAYFKYNSLLMSSTVVTNTFATDLSSNNLDITIVGDTKPSKFDPFELGYYSGYFDGTGDGLVINGNAGPIGTEDFTWECYAYISTMGGDYPRIFESNTGASGSFQVYLSGGTLTVGGNGTGTITSYSIASLTNQWLHLCITRTGSAMRIFVNGVLRAYSASGGNNFPSGGSAWRTINEGGGIIGYLSNMRVVRGSIVSAYSTSSTTTGTTIFTPPTSPLTAIAGTQFLGMQSSRFVDTSANAFTITVNGNTAVNPFQPFTPDNSYATYGSTYFDGTGDYLSIPTNAAFQFGTGDFTCESWVYISTTPPTAYVLWGDLRWSTGYSSGWCTHINSNLTITSKISGTSGSWVEVTSTATVKLSSWNHVAVSRASGTFSNFINGVLSGSQASANYNYTNAEPFKIGIAYIDGLVWPLTGYIADCRVIKGTAIYTANFTPSTTPLTVITNTSLLTCQTVVPQTTSVFVDESGQNNSITRNGNTNIGTFSPLNGSWSNYFDGTGDYLQTPSSSFSLGTVFTIEAWVYPTISPTNAIVFSSTSSGELSLGYYSNTGFGVAASGLSWLLYSATMPVVGAWNHIAVVRAGLSTNQTSIYINGTRVVNGTISNAFTGSGAWRVGFDGGGGGASWTGYISNLRVVAGTDVYGYTNTTITPSTTPLNSIANTKLLTCNSPSFVDYSPINNVITRNGDTAVNKFSPFPGYITNFASYSGYFDGTGDYLTVASSSAFNISGNFTVEGWYYFTAFPGAGANDNLWTFSGVTTYNPYLYLWGDGTIVLRTAQTSGTVFTVTHNFGLNIWYHIAVVKSSTNFTLYVNGTSVGTGTSSAIVSENKSLEIGGQSTFGLTGYLSNFRVVNGTAVYTSNFTPSTTPLTAIANTSLLTCQSTTFIDNSANAFAITVNGNTQPVIQNPFANTFTSPVAYSPTTTGSSMYFDGTTDYLTVPNSTAFGFSNGDFTIEFWVYPTVNARQDWVDVTDGSNRVLLYYSGSAITFYSVPTNAAAITGPAMVLNAWQHIALSKNSGSSRLYVNGAQVGSTYTSNQNYFTTSPVTIGKDSAGSTYVTGYMSNVRIVKGTAVYTGPFVPSNSPLPAVQNTVLLVSSTITPPVYDAAEINDIENVGASKLTTSNSPYYSSYSGQFDGTGDYLSIASNSVFQLGTGSYTFEAWIFPTTLGVLNTNNIINIGTYITGLMLRVNGTTTGLQVYTNNTERLATSTGLVANTWQHIALVRNGSACTVYINGVVNGTFTDSSNISPATATLTIGMAAHNSSEFFTGYMSNYRLVKGTAVYTSAFTPPTAPLTAIANTSLLTCQSNRFIDNSTNAFAITRNGDAKVSALQPFGGSNLTKYSSVYFDGTGDSLKILDNPNINLGSGNFTLECWVYFNVVNAQMTIINKGWNSSSAYASYLIWMNSDATLRFLASSNGSSWDIANEKVMGTMTSGSWIHIAVTRSGTSFRAFINGVINDSFTFTSASSLANIAAQTLFIGDRTNGDTSLNGYISDVRITNGYARYTTTFTPPTVPLLGF